MQSWLTRIIVVATVVRMTKTHLEHQLIKFKQNKYGNATTPDYDPYEGYDVNDGITTAVILGTTFLLTIVYISFKVGWQKFKRKFCDRLRRKRKEGDQERAIPKIDQSSAITIKDDVVVVDASSLDDKTSPSNKRPPHTSSRQQNSHTSENNSKHVRGSKSRSSSISPEKVLNGESQQLLPPAINQALRTAHWVNSVAAEATTSLFCKLAAPATNITTSLVGRFAHPVTDSNTPLLDRLSAPGTETLTSAAGDSKRYGKESFSRQSTTEVEINHVEMMPMGGDQDNGTSDDVEANIATIDDGKDHNNLTANDSEPTNVKTKDKERNNEKSNGSASNNGTANGSASNNGTTNNKAFNKTSNEPATYRTEDELEATPSTSACKTLDLATSEV